MPPDPVIDAKTITEFIAQLAVHPDELPKFKGDRTSYMNQKFTQLPDSKRILIRDGAPADITSAAKMELIDSSCVGSTTVAVY
jgi:hypothetical protein